MKINLTTQTLILTFNNSDLVKESGYLYEIFNKEFEEQSKNNPNITNIKTLAYNDEISDENEKLVLLIFDGEEFTQKKIILENYDYEV